MNHFTFQPEDPISLHQLYMKHYKKNIPNSTAPPYHHHTVRLLRRHGDGAVTLPTAQHDRVLRSVNSLSFKQECAALHYLIWLRIMSQAPDKDNTPLTRGPFSPRTRFSHNGTVHSTHMAR